MNGQEKCYKYYQITHVGFGTKGKKSIGQTILKAKKKKCNSESQWEFIRRNLFLLSSVFSNTLEEL